jgi:hypothetical protein
MYPVIIQHYGFHLEIIASWRMFCSGTETSTYLQFMFLHFGIAMRGSGSGKKFPNAVNNFRISLLSRYRYGTSVHFLACLVNPSTVPTVQTVPTIMLWINYSTYMVS